MPLSALAEAEQGSGQNATLLSIFYSLLPIALAFGLLYWFFKRGFSRRLSRNDLYMVRHEEHMERVEKSLERIAAALEKPKA